MWGSDHAASQSQNGITRLVRDHSAGRASRWSDGSQAGLREREFPIIAKLPKGRRMIKAIILDVDGVLTDGGVWFGPGGQEWKRFCFADIMGVHQAVEAGYWVAPVMTAEGKIQASEVSGADVFATKANVSDVQKGIKDKAKAVRDLAECHEIDLEDICFMGDYINDLEAMKIVGLAAAPANAHPSVLKEASFVSTKNGGNGAVRELVDESLQKLSDYVVQFIADQGTSSSCLPVGQLAAAWLASSAERIAAGGFKDQDIEADSANSLFGKLEACVAWRFAAGEERPGNATQTVSASRAGAFSTGPGGSTALLPAECGGGAVSS